MKINSSLRKIIISSWFLAGIPAILFTLFLHPSMSKYSLEVSQTRKYPGQYAYTDLNRDSISEIVFTGKGVPYYFIMAYDIDMHVYDQWNLTDSLNPDISDFFFGNYDQDKFQEVYIFTHNKDSLFLNVNEINDPKGLKIERSFITKIGYIGGHLANLLKPAGFFDMNRDGKDELYFVVSPHYRSAERHFYCFDLVNKRLNTSQYTGNIILSPKMSDIDGDGRPEIYGGMSASGNYRTNVPYSDSSTWLMVFNDQLKFKFPPVEFPGFGNGLNVCALNNNDERSLVVTHCVGGADTSILDPRVMIFSPQGKLLKYKLLSELGLFTNIFTLIMRNKSAEKIYLVGEKIYEMNSNLEIINSVSNPISTEFVAFKVDANNDGEEELVLFSNLEEKVLIYSGGLKKLAENKLTTPDYTWKFSHYFSKDHKHRLFMTSGNTGYFFDLKKNSFYYLGFSYYPGVYLFFFLFIMLIRKITTLQIEQRENLKQRLLTLQLQSIKGQLDPHFTFNTLNSIASLIYLEDREIAYDYMNKFTRLLRGMLNDAERIYRSLAEEIEFVITYLELEKLRFGDKFNFTMETGEGITKKEMVPKLVLQTFAENSIKHGIMAMDGGGMLKIKVEKENINLKLTIEDNGIGRARAAGRSTSTGKGLKLTDEFYSILNQINKKPILHTITDLYDNNGTAAGTRVEVWVPLEEEEDRS
jgi:two-component sensor histidine kinase